MPGLRRRIDRSRSTKKDSVNTGSGEERETASAVGAAAAAAPKDVHRSKDSSSDDDFTTLVQRQRSKVSAHGDPLKQAGEDLLDSESEDELPIQQKLGNRKAAPKRQLRRSKIPSKGKSPRAKDFPSPKENSEEEDLNDSESESEDKPDQQRTRRRQSASKRQTRKAKQAPSRKESSEEEGKEVTHKVPLTSRKRKGNNTMQAPQTRNGSVSKSRGRRRESKDSDDDFIARESEEDEYEYESEDKKSDDESEEDFDPDNNEEEKSPLSTRKRKSDEAQALQTPRRTTSKRETSSRASPAKKFAELDDDKEPVVNGLRRSMRSKDDEEPVVNGRLRSMRSKDDDDFAIDEGGDSKDHNNGDSTVDSVGESSDDKEEPARGAGRRKSPGNQRQSPSRAAARKASQKLATFKDDAEDEDNEVVTVRSTRRRSKKKSDDDAYEETESGESEEDLDDMASDILHDDQSFQGDADQVKKSKAAEVGDDFGTADDSSSDGEKWASPQLKLKPSPGVLRLDRDDDSEDDNSGPSNSFSTAKMPRCSSKNDVITEERLPGKHVCYFSPDGSHRQCFALETLHKIALTTPHPKFREDLTGGKQTFLQPPHFRSEMSDDLLDQIASRFGREALDLRSSFYNSRRQESAVASSEDDESEYIVNYSEALADSNHFLQRVGNYVQSQMGSQDIYACPICFTVAHRKIEAGPIWNYDDDDEDDVETEVAKCYPVIFRFDPITVLGSLKDFQIAASFCFKKVAKLKKHLRADHNVDTKCVQGNDLYERFKVRAPDGLLQRYLKRIYAHPKHGHLLRYWFEGNNYDLVYLLDLIPHVELCQEILLSQDQNEAKVVKEAREYLQPAQDYFDSFARLASKIWEVIVEPYRKLSEKDLGDFYFEGDVEEEDGDALATHRALDTQSVRQSMDSEQQMLEHLKTRLGRKGEACIEGEEESDSVDLEDDLEVKDEVVNPYDDVKNQGYFEESSSEEEDEWEKQIMSKKRDSLDSRICATPSKSSAKSPKSASSRKRRGKLKQEEESSSDDEAFENVAKISKRLRAIKDDSEDDA